LKLLELLLYLDELDLSKLQKHAYFYKSQVEKVKAIAACLAADPASPHTIAGLSARFDFPQTSMKLCFKSVFGTSVHSYLRCLRLNEAATRLRSGSEPVSDIAAAVGYANASKFAAAFRDCFGMSPSEYRRRYADFHDRHDVDACRP